MAAEPRASVDKTREARPVQQHQAHRRDPELVQRQGQLHIATREDVDTVTAEQRDVSFAQPQHRLDPDARPVARVVIRLAGCQASRETGVDQHGVSCSDPDPGRFLGGFELLRGDDVIGRQPRRAAGARHVEEDASGEHPVAHGGDGVDTQALGAEDVIASSLVVADTVDVHVAERVEVGAPSMHVQRDVVGDRDGRDGIREREMSREAVRVRTVAQ